MPRNKISTLFAFLPCYNEQDDIGSLVDRWEGLVDPLHDLGFQLQIYCIDDKSTDDTKAVIRRLVNLHQKNVHLVEHDTNRGLGGALTTAFNLFAERGSEGDLLVLMDGDDTHDPVYSLDMVPAIKAGADCVIASRYRGGSHTQGVSPMRLFMSYGARAFYSLMLHVRGVRDYTCGYRMYTYALVRESLRVYGGELVERKTFACMMEVLYKMSLLGASFSEVPFELRYDRKQGASKMRVFKTARDSIVTAVSLRHELGHRVLAQSRLHR